jgi:cobalt/nickel transport system permease protein
MHHHHIDHFAQSDSPVHRLDARGKLLATVAYMAVLLSYPRYSLAMMAPMAVGPLALLWAAGVPTRLWLRRVLLLSPLILMTCAMAAVYDRRPVAWSLGPWSGTTPGGWLTAGSIALKFVLGLAALTALVCSTPFATLLEAMHRLGTPRGFTTVLGFVYRYLFVLEDEALRLKRSRDFRGGAAGPFLQRLATAGGLIGTLFRRTLERSDRIELAMRARGFTGTVHGLQRLRCRTVDWGFLAASAGYLVFCRGVYVVWIGG